MCDERVEDKAALQTCVKHRISNYFASYFFAVCSCIRGIHSLAHSLMPDDIFLMYCFIFIFQNIYTVKIKVTSISSPIKTQEIKTHFY